MTANIGLFSQYGFRSIAQTGGQPAVQGEQAFYTDLTGYNTAKDAGIVYVKKTF